MPFGTACNRLRKRILFKYIEKAGENFCFKCGQKIKTVEELSIEHKIPWEGKFSKLFWDLNNIAFSHRKCNKKEKVYPNGRVHGVYNKYANEGCRCNKCKEIKRVYQKDLRKRKKYRRSITDKNICLRSKK